MNIYTYMHAAMCVAAGRPPLRSAAAVCSRTDGELLTINCLYGEEPAGQGGLPQLWAGAVDVPSPFRPITGIFGRHGVTAIGVECQAQAPIAAKTE
jgi:hypothetical protein